MLKIKYRENETAHPLQALCPWIDFITPNLVLNKDGSILAAFRFRGLDPDNLFEEQVDSVTKQMQRAYSLLDNRFTAWWIVDKRRDPTYPVGAFENPVAAEIDRLYSKGFTQGQHYSIDYTFYMLYTGVTGVDKFFDRVSRIQAENESGIAASIMSAIKESMSGRSGFARDISVIRENVTVFERALSGFINASPVNFQRLDGDDFTSALGTLLNRASPPARHRKPKGAMLDAWLPTDYIKAAPEVIQFKATEKSTYAAVLGMVKWPEDTSPMLFEELASLDMELTICQIVRFLDSTQTTAEIEKAIEYYNLTQYGVISHSIAKATGGTPEPKPGKGELLEQCKEARSQVGAEGITRALQNTTVFVYGNSMREVDRNVALASQNLAQQRFKVIRERENAMPSYAAMLPGQWAMQSRFELNSIENVADTTPLYTMDEGARRHPFFSDDVYKQDVPNFAIFGNSYGGRFNFSPHVQQVGHLVIVAPTGGGKTTFVNFVISQFQRYGKVRTYIFDRNLSCRIVTELHGGTHIDIKGKTARFNPFFAMMDGSPDGQLWVREWIMNRFAEGGYKPTTEDRKAIDIALNQMASMHKDGNPLSLSNFAVLVPSNLQDELGEWLHGRAYGMFDSETDDYAMSNWTTTEMREIMAIDRLSRAFMEYAFRKIYVSLDGTPTFIYLEEASFLLNNEVFKDMIDDWLKTMRKKNAFIWMTIQSPDSITSSSISASILDNVFSFVFLKNNKVESHRKAYKSSFGLEDHQIDMIANLQPRRDYLLVQDGEARILQTHFSPEVLAYLRSEENVQVTYERHKNSGVENWKEAYLAELSAQSR